MQNKTANRRKAEPKSSKSLSHKIHPRRIILPSPPDAITTSIDGWRRRFRVEAVLQGGPSSPLHRCEKLVIPTAVFARGTCFSPDFERSDPVFSCDVFGASGREERNLSFFSAGVRANPSP